MGLRPPRRAGRRVAAVALVAVALTPACGASPAAPGADDGRATGLTVVFDEATASVFDDATRSVVVDVAEAAHAEIAPLLPTLPGAVTLVVAAGLAVIPETGEVGAATAPGAVRWTVDTTRSEGAAAIASTHLRSTLFHELHHLARDHTFESEPAARFVDLAIAEGLATAFQRDAAGTDPPWGQYPPEEVAGWVDELLVLPVDADARHWLFEHPDGRRWIGYRAGTYLADLAIEASGRTAAELADVPAAEILALAGHG